MRPVGAKVGLDTSVVVPLLAAEHASHEKTRREVERLRQQQASIVVAPHALLESYSVLTRMPPPYRFSPEAAEQLLRDNFADGAEVPGLAPESLWNWLQEFALKGISGGSIYDAVIARSTFEAGAGVLLTWNLDHFLRVAPAGLETLTPEQYASRSSRLH